MPIITTESGTFNMSYNQDVLSISIEGRVTQELVDRFVPDFQAQVQKIRPANTELVLDVSKVGVVTTDMQEILKGCFQLYKTLGFKKIIFNHGNNVILKMQSRRLGQEVGLDNLEIV